eukprot:GHVP01019113.1.p1 GENE.GHVP01019113.1~~GHVP01019113.1.p1  ORF type:complete len:118 (+),score=1.80 GHVP01019113.1:582-935(+)
MMSPTLTKFRASRSTKTRSRSWYSARSRKPSRRCPCSLRTGTSQVYSSEKKVMSLPVDSLGEALKTRTASCSTSSSSVSRFASPQVFIEWSSNLCALSSTFPWGYQAEVADHLLPIT